MTNTDALQALADKVEAGEFPADTSARDLGFENCGNGFPIIKTMYAAFSGSLDAAKALHDVVLPGWIYLIGSQISGVSMSNHEDPRWWNAMHNGHPSRGWLLAILRALIAGGRDAQP